MNVLVFSGSNVLQTSLTHTLSTLRALLLPNYSVQTITLQSLVTHPWSSTCALLVFPAFNSTPIISPSLASAIISYVDAGGSLLVLGAGAELQDTRSTLEGALGGLSIVDSGGLKFSDRARNRYIIPKFGSFDDGTESVQPAKISLYDGSKASDVLHHRPLPLFDETTLPDSIVLAKYDLEGGSKSPAVVHCRVNEGRVVFSSLRLDLPVEAGPDTSRKALLRKTLESLGIKVPVQELGAPSHPMPQLLTSTPSKTKAVAQVLTALDVSLEEKLFVIQDSQDTLYFYRPAEGQALLQTLSDSPSNHSDPNTWQPKHIVVYTDGALPPSNLTPLFNLQKFYGALSDARTQARCLEHPDTWGVGEILLYGQAVTSTQTMLDKYGFCLHPVRLVF